MARNHIEFGPSVEKDLRRIGNRRLVERLRKAITDGLGSDPTPPNLDVRPLTDAAPWLRLRLGDYRVIFRRMSDEELGEAGRWESDVAGGFVIDRIIHRRDLDKAVSTL